MRSRASLGPASPWLALPVARFTASAILAAACARLPSIARGLTPGLAFAGLGLC